MMAIFSLDRVRHKKMLLQLDNIVYISTRITPSRTKNLSQFRSSQVTYIRKSAFLHIRSQLTFYHEGVIL